MKELPKILLVDDSNLIVNALTQMLQEELKVEVFSAASFAETQKLLEEHESSFSLAIVDLNLPDCEVGDAVRHVVTYDIPTIILTGMVNESVKELQQDDKVLEYVYKDDKGLPYILKISKKLIQNLNASVLVVDDSDLQINLIKMSLKLINIVNVHTAKDGLEALEVLKNNPEIFMVITDYEMPNMNGIELVNSIREKVNKDKLSIIGLSATGNKELVTNFLLAGANDFLSKPFDMTEFHTRINNNIEMHWLFQENENQKKVLQDYAFLDLLTKSFNRAKYLMMIKRYCKKFSKTNYVKHAKGLYQIQISVKGLEDINKDHGYAAGDTMLKSFVHLVQDMLEKHETLYRILSAEFVIISPNTDLKTVQKTAEKIQKKLRENTKSKKVEYIFSITQYNPKHKINDFVIGNS